MARLTGFSKLIITLLILAVIFFGGKYLYDNTSVGAGLKEQMEAAKEEAAQGQSTTTTTSPSNPNSGKKNPPIGGGRADDDNTLVVQLVTWGGYAPGLYFNEGAAANTRSRFYKDYGFKVDFKLNNDLFNALDGWIAGEYDVLVQTADAFPLYTAPDDINALGVIKTPDNFKAAELFRSKDVDAAVVWSPDDIFATQDVPGSKILLTTREQSHIIADIMFASEDYISENKDKINKFYEGWMKAVAEIQNPANQDKAAKYLAELNSISVDDAKGMMSTVYWTGHGDNKNFFGLDRGYRGQKGEDLYGKMAKKFVETGDAEKVAPTWRSVTYTGAVTAADAKLAGSNYGGEKAKVFKPKASDKTAAPISSKPVSISFPSGSSTLSENAKTIIDIQFAETAKVFGNTKIRVEGNTDSDGGRAMNVQLSQKRAQAVAAYLKSTYNMDANRFVIVGNGPDKPVAGCEQNQNAACKAKNRRTDFQLIGG